MKRHFLISIAVFVALVAVATGQKQTSAQDEKNERAGWRYIGKTGDGDKVYYNPERIIEKSSTVKEAWVKFFAPKGRIYETVYQLDLDCVAARQRPFFEARYRKNGTLIREINEPTAAWGSIVPGTASDELFQVVCKGRKPATPKVSSTSPLLPS